MRRAKIGDVYYMKLTNGYKIYQWAYRIPKDGDYIRVFDGLYNEVPTSEYIENLVKTEHSYIIGFNAGRAYRTELAFLIGNYTVPDEYPFPDYMLTIRDFDNGNYQYEFNGVNNWFDGDRFYAKTMEELPNKFKNIKLLNSYPSASWIMYLFEIGFDLTKPELFWPISVKNGYEIVENYQKIVDAALENEKDKRKKK